MMTRARLYRFFQPAIWPVLGLALVAYFLVHTINGNHGLIARQTLKDRIISAEAALNVLKAERKVLERRVTRLSPGTLDLDMLDERVRVMLDYSHPDDAIIYRYGESSSQRESNSRGAQ